MATATPNGITFDGLHSYTDFGLWLVARPDTGSPRPKLNQVEVPGMDGTLDMTEVNAGEVKFTNRTMVFRFAGKVGINDHAAFKAAIMDALHGKRIEKIILDEDSLWYYSGRVTVQFPEAKPWKVYCTITVDADPYAIRTIENVVPMNPSVYDIETQIVTLAENTSTNPYVSIFELGTKVFPNGLNTSFGFTALKISWTDASPWLGNRPKTVTVNDADGNEFTQQYSPALSAHEITVAFTTLTQAGIDLSKVYRVTVSGIGQCTLTSEASLAYIEVQNTRKPVVPRFLLEADTPVQIMVNGVSHEIPVGAYQSAEIMLHGGKNEIYVSANQAANITMFLMSYRGGKL